MSCDGNCKSASGRRKGCNKEDVWCDVLPIMCPDCDRAGRVGDSVWNEGRTRISETLGSGVEYTCAACYKLVVRRGGPVCFGATVDEVGGLGTGAHQVGARAHVRLHLATPSGNIGAYLGSNIMEKHHAEAFLKLLQRDRDEKDTTLRACAWCGGNICSAEGITGTKCPSCEDDFKAGKPKPKGFDE